MQSFTFVDSTQLQSRTTSMETSYHPLLFSLMTLAAVAELGLAAFLVCVGNEYGMWPSSKYHSLLILVLFNASWTILFSAAYMLWVADKHATQFLANVASSVIWLLLTGILWGAASGLMLRMRSGGDCAGTSDISRCRQSLTVEALGWTEFGICLLTLIITCLFVGSTESKKKIPGLLVADPRRIV